MMGPLLHDSDLFQQALGLQDPWSVVGAEFDAEERRLELVAGAHVRADRDEMTGALVDPPLAVAEGSTA
jgi:hypothetical protein